jgi:hypothetical protein
MRSTFTQNEHTNLDEQAKLAANKTGIKIPTQKKDQRFVKFSFSDTSHDTSACQPKQGQWKSEEKKESKLCNTTLQVFDEPAPCMYRFRNVFSLVDAETIILGRNRVIWLRL